jgi:hypothetical protein
VLKQKVSWQEAAGLALVTLVAGGFFLAAEHRIAGGLGFPLDDAWIHMQFARNFALGNGFGFNPGEVVSASSAPLWTLVLAAWHLAPVDVVIAAKGTGLLLLWLCGLATLWLGRLLGLGPWAGFGVGLVVVLTPRLLWGSLSGMEITLYSALATTGVGFHLARWDKAPALAGTACFALATLARPECFILFPLALVDRWRQADSLRSLLVEYRFHLLLFALLLAPFVAFNWYTLGKPLPNTFYAKVGSYSFFGAVLDGDFVRMAKTLLFYPILQAQELIRFSAENNVVLSLLAGMGLVRLLALKDGRKQSWLLPLVLIGFPILRGILAPFKGATFQHGRYAANLIPLVTLVGALGLGETMRWLATSLSFPQQQRLKRWGSGCCWSLILANPALMDLQYAQTLGMNVDNINQMHVEMGRWLAANTPPQAVIATHDIGAIGYFSNRKVLDTAGLITPQVLAFLQPGVAADAGVLAFLQQTRPEFLVILPNWYPALASKAQFFQPIHEIFLPNNTIAAGPRMVVYRTHLKP